MFYLLISVYPNNVFFANRQTVCTQIRLLLEEQSDPGPHCLQKWILKSQADDKADDNCCDWQFKGKDWYMYVIKYYTNLQINPLRRD